ncbi:threonine kinase in B12 biosynthesis [Klebsiella pneumoniae subsp. pneumoniae]|nr:threonine kinase in B12 biosynthesis [Klebsiella pneumoniae subsp. pneumoniae]
MVSTWRTAAASSACCWTAVGHDVEFLQWRLADSDIAAHWPQQHLLAMVPGGVILQ